MNDTYQFQGQQRNNLNFGSIKKYIKPKHAKEM